MRARANFLRWPVCVLFLLVALCTAATGEVIYVDDDAAGANDGSSWSDAFTDLQDALVVALEGDEIRVAQGIYTPTQDPLDRDATFDLEDGVSITGGYAGLAGMYPDFRHTKFFATILSGDIDHNDDIVDPNNKEGNSHHVVTCTGESNAAVLEGVTITGGYSNMTGGRGGHGSEFGAGGGLYCQRGCSPQLIDCIFTDNYAEGGGAVYMSDIYGLTGEEVFDEHSWKPVFVRCIFTDNNDRAVSCGSKWHPEFINCLFENNSAGAISAGQSSTLKFNQCVFRGNSADRSGGVIGTSTTGAEMQFMNCLFEDNSAGFDGGAISSGRKSKLEFNHCIFRRNSAGRRGGAIYTYVMSEVRIINCLFVANTSYDSGGAIAVAGVNDGLGLSWYKLINCTFYGNTSPTFYKPPTNTVIRPDNSREYYSASIITNCIFYNSISNEPSDMPVSFEFGRSEPLIITSIYEKEPGQAGAIPPTPDPLFVDPYGADGILGTEDDDFRLAPDSPAIDSGTNETFLPLPAMDLDGYPRILNGIVDLGAYEFTGVHAKYGGGTGEADDPYLIYTDEQMNAIGAEPNDWDKHFKLMADIDLSSYKGTDFNIIGIGYLPAFTGVFDGNGHTISHFTYTSADLPGVGIFGYINDPNACISNLGLIEPNVDGGTGIGVGSLAGWIEMGTITNCYAMGGTISAEAYVGGLVGTSAGAIIDCYATTSVTGSYRVGGLVGGNSPFGGDARRYTTGIVERCYTAGSVTGNNAVGGLVGTNHGASIVNCSSTTNVTGGDRVGGLVGENDGDVGNCYSYCTVDAEDMVGGLVGMNEGIVMASCSSASVQGREEVGGLVGRNSDRAETLDCYANGDVLGQKYVGGLVGNNRMVILRGGGQYYGTVRTCYSATAVSGDQQIGGLVGYDQGGGVRDCFWDVETSGQTTSAGGVGKTKAQMQTAGTFLDAGWDFVDETENGIEDVWAEPDGGGYPILSWQLSPLPELPTFSGGTGEPDEPYLISTADELNSIGHKPRLMAAHFKLINDIDLAGVKFYIIASRWYPFRGVFDGNGRTISNFSYTSADATCTGLFRYVAGAQIKDLGLIGPDIQVDRGDFHGSLVGCLVTGTVTDCYVEDGSVSGGNYVGGLVGSNSSGTITNCCARGGVSRGFRYVGGLAGRNSGTATNCYATGSVSGGDEVGGLVGENGGRVMASFSYASVQGRNAVGGLVGRCSPGEIVNCYANGDVAGQWYVGGLVGTNGSGTRGRTGAIRNCYSATTILGGAQNGGLLGADWGGEASGCFWDIETSGRTKSYGGEGKTTAEMQMAGTFLDAGWDFVDESVNGIYDIWRISEGQDYPRLVWE